MPIPVVTWWDENSNAWDDVWASDFFKALARTPSWLSEHVVPLLKKQQIGWITPPENSRFYFSAWFMNCVMRREYDNKIIQDLYILHEALHAATIDNYFKESDNLFHALRVNEIEVSLETEAWIYLRHPEILRKTFDPLWVLQNDMFSKKDENRSTSRLASRREDDYRLLAKNTPWPIPRPPTMFQGQLVSESDMWWARRRSTFFPTTPADFQVKKYDDLSVRWISSILDRAPLVNFGRSILLRDRDLFMKYLEDHEVDGLPFGDLSPQYKPTK